MKNYDAKFFLSIWKQQDLTSEKKVSATAERTLMSPIKTTESVENNLKDIKFEKQIIQ